MSGSDDTPGLTQATARKALGQHFLFDPDILKRTALAAGPVEGRTVIEVGPGPGGLTRALLDQGAGNVVRWESVLEELGASQPAMIVANLPYNVGTPLLVNWLKAGPWRGEMALMFQKEVAERICAKPNSDHYGRLAVLAHAVCDPHIAFTLPPGAFRPPPKVDSAVAVLHPLPAERVFPHLAKLEEVAGAAFGQRRKMLRAALKPLAKRHGLKAADWLQDLGIDPTARAETLTQDEFRHMASSLVK